MPTWKNVPLSGISLWLEKIIKLENIIYLSVVGLPLYLVKLDFFGVPSNALEIIQAAVIFWWFCSKNYQKPKIHEIMQKYGKYLFASSLIFFGLLSSMFVNGNYRVGAGIIKSWFLLPLLFSFVALNVISREKIKNIFLSIYTSSVIVSSIALAYYFFGSLTYDGRLEAFFNSPNYLAMYLAPALIIGLLKTRNQQPTASLPTSEAGNQQADFKIEAIYYVSCGIIAIALYLTFSYAAWIAIVGSLLIAEIIKSGKGVLNSKVFWGSIILTALLFSSQWNSGKLRDAYSVSNRSSLASRVMIWKTAGKLVKDNPLWGIGPGNFQSKYLEYQNFFPPYLEWAVPHPHNIFLAFFLYSGLTGISGFVLLAFFWFRAVLKKEDSRHKAIFLAIMAYILLHGLVDTIYFKNDLAVIFWLNFLALKLKKTSSGPR